MDKPPEGQEGELNEDFIPKALLLQLARKLLGLLGNDYDEYE